MCHSLRTNHNSVPSVGKSVLLIGKLQKFAGMISQPMDFKAHGGWNSRASHYPSNVSSSVNPYLHTTITPKISYGPSLTSQNPVNVQKKNLI